MFELMAVEKTEHEGEGSAGAELGPGGARVSVMERLMASGV